MVFITKRVVRGIRERGPTERFSRANRVALEKGDLLRLVTANGGGWGPAKARSLDAIQDDIKNQYISVEQARRDYPEQMSLA